MAYENFEDLNRRAASDKTLRYKAFIIAKGPKYNGHQRGLASIIFDKKLVVVLKMEICQTKNQLKNYINQLLENLKKRKVQAHFIDNIWDADLADMELISKFN